MILARNGCFGFFGKAFVLAFFLVSGLLYAQIDPPADSESVDSSTNDGFYLALDAGVGTSSVLVDGLSFNLLLVPKLSLTPDFMIGAKNFLHISTDNIVALETQAFFRWNFMRLESFFNTALFAQGGVGFLGAFKGSDVRDSRASMVFDATVGATIPLNSRWHIEPMIRGGFPFIIGVDITAGYKFPLTKSTGKETEYVEVVKIQQLSPNEIIRRVLITQVEYIIFAPDGSRFNYGIDRDAQSLNELVIDHCARILRENPDFRIRLEGHANPVTHAPGEIDELIALSARRANEVARVLMQRGVAEEQIVIIAYGGARIVAATGDHAHWNMNRRVELIIIEVDLD